MAIEQPFWTASTVEDRVREAARTLRLSPSSDTRYLAGKGSMWPDFKRDSASYAYGYQVAVAKPAKPTALQIARLDQMIGWFADYLKPSELPEGLPRDTNKVLWGRASGMSWPRIREARKAFYGISGDLPKGGRSPIPGGNSVPVIRGVYWAGLEYFADRLRAADISPTTWDRRLT